MTEQLVYRIPVIDSDEGLVFDLKQMKFEPADGLGPTTFAESEYFKYLVEMLKSRPDTETGRITIGKNVQLMKMSMERQTETQKLSEENIKKIDEFKRKIKEQLTNNDSFSIPEIPKVNEQDNKVNSDLIKFLCESLNSQYMILKQEINDNLLVIGNAMKEEIRPNYLPNDLHEVFDNFSNIDTLKRMLFFVSKVFIRIPIVLLIASNKDSIKNFSDTGNASTYKIDQDSMRLWNELLVHIFSFPTVYTNDPQTLLDRAIQKIDSPNLTKLYNFYKTEYSENITIDMLCFMMIYVNKFDWLITNICERLLYTINYWVNKLKILHSCNVQFPNSQTKSKTLVTTLTMLHNQNPNLVTFVQVRTGRTEYNNGTKKPQINKEFMNKRYKGIGTYEPEDENKIITNNKTIPGLYNTTENTVHFLYDTTEQPLYKTKNDSPMEYTANNGKPAKFTFYEEDSAVINTLKYPVEIHTGPFTKTFTNLQNNLDVFVDSKFKENIMTPLLDGSTVCIFGYGSSGSGKTSVLIKLTPAFGNNEDGLLILASNAVGNKGYKNCSVTIYEYGVISFLEQSDKNYKINGEIAFSGNYTFGNDNKWHIKSANGSESKDAFQNKGYFQINGNSMCSNDDMFDDILFFMTYERMVAATPNNNQSSRSHVIIVLKYTDNKDEKTLIICDLAGVENTFDCNGNFDSIEFDTVEGDVPLESTSCSDAKGDSKTDDAPIYIVPAVKTPGDDFKKMRRVQRTYKFKMQAILDDLKEYIDSMRDDGSIKTACSAIFTDSNFAKNVGVPLNQYFSLIRDKFGRDDSGKVVDYKTAIAKLTNFGSKLTFSGKISITPEKAFKYEFGKGNLQCASYVIETEITRKYISNINEKFKNVNTGRKSETNVLERIQERFRNTASINKIHKYNASQQFLFTQHLDLILNKLGNGKMYRRGSTSSLISTDNIKNDLYSNLAALFSVMDEDNAVAFKNIILDAIFGNGNDNLYLMKDIGSTATEITKKPQTAQIELHVDLKYNSVSNNWSFEYNKNFFNETNKTEEKLNFDYNSNAPINLTLNYNKSLTGGTCYQRGNSTFIANNNSELTVIENTYTATITDEIISTILTKNPEFISFLDANRTFLEPLYKINNSTARVDDFKFYKFVLNLQKNMFNSPNTNQSNQSQIQALLEQWIISYTFNEHGNLVMSKPSTTQHQDSGMTKRLCEYRTKEGKYINESLRDMRNDIASYVLNKGKQNLPPFDARCLPIQCNPEFKNCMGVDRYSIPDPTQYSTKKYGDLFNKITDITKPNENLVLCVFCILNVSEPPHPPDPPKIPYIDITRLQQYYEIMQNEGLFNDVTKIYNTVKSEIEKVYNDNRTQLEQIKFPFNPIERMNANKNQIPTIAKEFIDFISNSNAATPIGTLLFTDSFAKGFAQVNTCNLKEYIHSPSPSPTIGGGNKINNNQRRTLKNLK